MKNEMKHTPGPWRICEYFKAETPAVHGAHGIFARDSVLPLVGEVFGSTLDESDANARLIAAAPEMRERLARHLQFLESLRALGGVTGETINHEIGETRALLARIDGIQKGA